VRRHPVNSPRAGRQQGQAGSGGCAGGPSRHFREGPLSQALYNRYRPASFAQVIGQDHVTKALSAALSNGRIHHAYLFSGPRGCGKTSSARILAASLNCIHGPTPDPCGECEHCVAVRQGSSMDVVEIDAASHGGVDDTRDLRERAVFTPASARFKVYIIDEAHQVSREGFNALLKLVEEPPPHLKFVFATTEPDRVLQTIRSRTHHYAFRLVSPSVLRDHLAAVCRSEGVDIDPAVLPLVVRAAAGSVRDSLSVLDQLLAGAGPGGLSAAEASVLLGLTDGVLLDDAVDSLVARDGASLFGVVDRVVTSGHDPRRFATDLLERLRDLMVLEAVPDAPSRGMLEACAPDQLDRMRGQAGRMGAVELSRAADVVHDGLVQMRGTTNPRLLLELVLARALLPSAAADPAALLVRLERVERRLAATGDAPVRPVVAAPAAGPGAPAADALSAAATPGPPLAPPPAVPPPAAEAAPGTVLSTPTAGPAPTPRPTPRPTPTADSAPPPAPTDIAPGGVDAESVRRMWDEVLRAVRARSRTSEVILAQYAEVAEVTGGEQTGRELTLFFNNPAMARNLARGTGENDLRDALTEVVGGGWRIVVRTGDAGAPGAVVGPGRAKPTASTTTATARATATTAAAAATTAAAAAAPGTRPTESNTGPKPGDASPDDEDLPSLGSGEEAAVALLRQGLGARVVEEHEGRRT